MSREKSYSEIGARIRLIRERLGLNQKSFAQELGIKQSWLSELETGLKEPSPVLLKSLEYRYKIHHHWILFGTDEKHNPGMTFDQMLDLLLHAAEVGEARALYSSESTLSKIIEIASGLDEETRRDVLRYLEKEKLLADLKRERDNKRGD